MIIINECICWLEGGQAWFKFNQIVWISHISQFCHWMNDTERLSHELGSWETQLFLLFTTHYFVLAIFLAIDLTSVSENGHWG